MIDSLPTELAKRAKQHSGNNIADNISIAQSNKECEVEVDSLRAELESTKKQLREKTVEVEKSTQLFTMFDQQVREMHVLLEQNDSMKRVYVETMIKYLTELEDKNRKERRIFLNEQSIKLGRVSTVR